MATLMLSSVGSAIAGPLGAALGGLIGQAVDRTMLGASPRSGPRLGDLSVQTSSYGSMIPRIYGRMRVAGTVVWATDLQEGTELQTGGKGQPDAQIYSYSVSLAVALSSRPISSVGRMWADGQLIRGIAEDFKVKTEFRLHTGHEDQQPDPFIASVEGPENTPAFRGIAVAVFEDLQLASFGNRIPMLTFEVIADEEVLSAGAILSDLSSGLIEGDINAQLTGFAAHGSSVKQLSLELADALSGDLYDTGRSVMLGSGSQITQVNQEELGCSSGGGDAPPIERHQTALSDLADAVSVTFYDEARDYQLGTQQSCAGDQIRLRRQIELPAVVETSAAKGLTDRRLASEWLQRSKLRLKLPPTRLMLEPGSIIRLPDSLEDWVVDKTLVDGLVVVADLVRGSNRQLIEVEADAGRALQQVDQIAKPTKLAAIELPSWEGSAGLNLHIAATGGQTPWRSAPIQVEANGLASTHATARRRAVIGETLAALGPSGSALLDLTNVLDVRLAHQEDWLQSCSDEALASGGNMAAIGDEIVQFGRAIPLGEGRFQLSRFLRGRGGTEWAAELHAMGDHFVLLDAVALSRIDLPQSALDTDIVLTPQGLGDFGTQSQLQHRVAGESVRPPSPVHLRFETNADGSIMARWTRRSRVGWTWSDGREVPLGESTEEYRVRFSGSRSTLELVTADPFCHVTKQQLFELGTDIVVRVAQLGDFRVSHDTFASVTFS